MAKAVSPSTEEVCHGIGEVGQQEGGHRVKKSIIISYSLINFSHIKLCHNLGIDGLLLHKMYVCRHDY